MAGKSMRERFEKVLSVLNAETSDISASAIVRKDGLVVASILPKRGVDERMLAAMTALALGLGGRVVESLDQGRLRKVIIEGEKGQMVIMGVRSLILAVLARKDANMGLVLLSMEKTLESLRELV
ncbi:MAG: roadblock/LC7 domain-containing protein [Candidatus Freyarchaeota archaeon]